MSHIIFGTTKLQSFRAVGLFFFTFLFFTLNTVLKAEVTQPRIHYGENSPKSCV